MKLYHGSNVEIDVIDLKQGRRGKDKQFLVECLTTDLATMLIEDYGYTMDEALDLLYTSKTFEKIERESTGLYYQGSVYVMQHLLEEMAKKQ